MATVFLRLLAHDDKPAALAQAVECLRDGEASADVHFVDPESFRQVPEVPFAYWVSERLRTQFTEHHPLEAPGLNRIARRGVGTNDDFRFLRLWFEITQTRQRWPPLAKGGAFARYYSPLPLVLDWRDQCARLKAFCIENGVSPSKNIRSESEYYRRGLTWSRRTQGGLSIRTLPDGCVFGDKGPAVFVGGDEPATLFALLALTNSRAFSALVELQMTFGSYEVGVLQRTPVPDLSGEQAATLSGLARSSMELKRSLDTADETSHAFHLPSLLQTFGNTLSERIAAWREKLTDAERKLVRYQSEIEEIAFSLYGIDGEDRRMIEVGANAANSPGSDEDEDEPGDDS